MIKSTVTSTSESDPARSYKLHSIPGINPEILSDLPSQITQYEFKFALTTKYQSQLDSRASSISIYFISYTVWPRRMIQLHC